MAAGSAGHACTARQQSATVLVCMSHCRNVTIQGPAGRQPDDWPVLDFGMVDGVIQLCSGCIVTLTRLVIEGERKGSGPVYDVFVGQPGPLSAQVRSIDTVRLRSACTPAAAQMKAIMAMPRSLILPNRTAPQGAHLQDVIYKVGGAQQAGCWF